MSSPKSRLIVGVELLDALLATKAPLIKWIRGRDSFHITPDKAHIICKSSVYEGKYHNGRVHFIREIDLRPALVIDLHFWDGRATMRYDKQVDRHTVAAWDLYFASHLS